jgi:protein-L-isoaspartate(D-aspartate) O-methyltransferase
MHDFAALRRRLVDNQIRPSEITDRALIEAFLTVPREIFVAPPERPFAYSDRELPYSALAPDRKMIDPVQLARLIEMLPAGGPEAKMMVIGCGTGYAAALLARLCGSVIAVEEDERLAAAAAETLAGLSVDNVTVARARLTEGYPAGAPYDAILIEGAVETVPAALVAQLKQTGALAVILREERISRAMLYERVGDDAAKWPQFEAWAALLPGFQKEREFVF